jgi:hypothetical protein
MNLTSFGLIDKPITLSTEDTLNLGGHARALADFIRRCDTAMTIAIQGDWGSGKTSMMGMIKELLTGSEGNDNIRKTVWINTWELAQFGQDENLPVMMLSDLAGKLDDSRTEKYTKLKRNLWRLGRASVVAVGAAVGQGETVQAFVDNATADEAEIPDDTVALVSRLKEQLNELVQGIVLGNDEARVVFFIDDLDRLVPVRAVELLEVMKVFLDMPGCVFVLACDYQVVMKGLTAKFGVSEAQLSGKSFFDKIIQVPYSMPMHRYDVDKYLGGVLIRVCGGSCSEADVRLYRQLVDSSVGFNPRGIKRIMNALMLMKDVTKEDRPEQFCSEQEWVRILFGILCMQSAYPALFQYLCGQELSDQLLRGLQSAEKLSSNQQLARIRKRAGDGEAELDWELMADFVGAFYEALQLKSDAQGTQLLSPDELKVLQKLLDSSSLVSVQPKRVSRRRSLDDFGAEFLAGCAGDAQAESFFGNLLTYLQENGIHYRTGEKGMAIYDQEDKVSLMEVFPPGATRRQPLSFKAANYSPEARAALKDLLPKETHAKLDQAQSFSTNLESVSWEQMRQVLEVILPAAGDAEQ